MLVKKLFGSRNDRLVKKKNKLVKSINVLEAEFEALSDEALQAKTAEFRDRLASGTVLEDLIPEAFAAVREASVRVLGMRHFDEQLIGGMVLNDGKISEMKTGEGKTLVATLSVYLNALPGKGVHVVTVNDYLAKRDSAWMGRIYTFLGMTTGVIVSEIASVDRREAYGSDITYGTNNEFGFDYLRDNMAYTLDSKVQRGLHYAVIDEVDSILIDEARTPLVISGPTEESTEMFVKVNQIIPGLTKQEKEGETGDYSVDEKMRTVHLTEAGHARVEQIMAENGYISEGGSLYDAANIRMMHFLSASLRAHVLYHRDVDYIVKSNEVLIVDEFTGRIMSGRRWGDGLHQAIEAKEQVRVQEDNQTLASITFQNYFRLYHKLSGMTGTADTEAIELQKIYGLEVVVIPTHRPMVRDDRGDHIYMTVGEKYNAIIEDIQGCSKRGQPVLVGTTSIENSELISRELTKNNVKHEILNAKQHEREAHIIEQAGTTGAVTIATNMAGRGTDIVLGGNLDVALKSLGENPSESALEKVKEDWRLHHERVLASGGLHVIGSERHESRRIDNQLRGRSGRQGDPGSSHFYLSLEDDLMRIFASEKVASMMQKLGMVEGEAIEHPWVTRAIENAQKKVEGRNYDIRKQILDYDDVANDQRKVIYGQRNDLMEAKDISDIVGAFRDDVVSSVVTQYIPEQTMEDQWDVAGLEGHLQQEFELTIPWQAMLEKDHSLQREDVIRLTQEKLVENWVQKESNISSDVMRNFEKSVVLQVLDSTWKEHLGAMDHLRAGIHLRGYAQRDPKQEYKRESFEMFVSMLDFVKYEVVGLLSKVQVNVEEDLQAFDDQRQEPQEMNFEHADAESSLSESVEPTALEAGLMPPPQAQGVEEDAEKPFVRDGRKVGRNDPCPCGSGKKFKQCHGKLT
ncbi:MAG: preprotein translocase subunit SecA [Methylococcales bacterium]|jgi:preprotein translocase subunit SecA|nr:preprotein translocase subunit SecA [Methylococcaceae bacterium]HIL41483.1 preprotein translocase subunit SecA [Methylococcales bacterium]